MINVDAPAVGNCVRTSNLAWSAPVQIAVSLVLLNHLIGSGTWAGFGIVLVAFAVQGVVMPNAVKAQKAVMKGGDSRLKAVRELFQGRAGVVSDRGPEAGEAMNGDFHGADPKHPPAFRRNPYRQAPGMGGCFPREDHCFAQGPTCGPQILLPGRHGVPRSYQSHPRPYLPPPLAAALAGRLLRGLQQVRRFQGRERLCCFASLRATADTHTGDSGVVEEIDSIEIASYDANSEKPGPAIGIRKGTFAWPVTFVPPPKPESMKKKGKKDEGVTASKADEQKKAVEGPIPVDDVVLFKDLNC
ncbi:hypothetical protein BDK51DRAFT_40998 [Blyttiomyces helicus]|uniref:Uncharacterized protein n=1 Tax=Blyttiomyces helicus TaxID=388810 RepID=A0A4P9W8T8_9FUNG|nr:hypothetical protein BDK51DRAFT_40998 [Blyttiomyces helicus]|eukprot:RKO88552.1 hypothetical protein BDK51DRAFT_40998 [Blyttiomyces helicus]